MINKKYLKRKIDEKLIKWKESEDHLPLIVSGARQVGKSSSILHFANTHYKNVIEINFIDHPEYKKILDDGYSAKAITKIISLLQISKFPVKIPDRARSGLANRKPRYVPEHHQTHSPSQYPTCRTSAKIHAIPHLLNGKG